MRPLILALTVLALAACAPAVTPAPGDMAEAPMSAPQGGTGPEATACAARGGELRPVCRTQTIQCVIQYSDAGRTCRDGDDCQGDCRTDAGAQAGAAVTGQCQASSDPCGCFATVEDGRATAALCVD